MPIFRQFWWLAFAEACRPARAWSEIDKIAGRPNRLSDHGLEIGAD
jgi:hypothetical protein